MNTIYKCIRGSHATGLSTKNSDRDIFEVVLPPPECLLGLANMKGSQHIDTNTGDDCRVITLKELVLGAIGGRSTEIEWLFVDEEHVLAQDPDYALLDMRDEFVSARLFKSQLGFANGNLQKALNGNKDRFQDDLGYDPKAASHGLRALWQAIQLKRTGQLEVVPSGYYRECIMAAKKGIYTPHHLQLLFKAWNAEFDITERHPALRDEPNFESLNDWIMDIHKEWIDASSL